jgi:hypothetical protein
VHEDFAFFRGGSFSPKLKQILALPNRHVALADLEDDTTSAIFTINNLGVVVALLCHKVGIFPTIITKAPNLNQVFPFGTHMALDFAAFTTQFAAASRRKTSLDGPQDQRDCDLGRCSSTNGHQ